MDIFALFQCLHPHVTATTVRQCSRMAAAVLVMTGRVTLLGLSRWAGPGGSDGTVQRCFSTVLPWATRCWVFFRHQMYRAEDVDLLAGDEVVVTKAGQPTQGLDRFFARLDGKPGPGLACFTLSWVSTPARSSCPMGLEQVGRSAAEKAASKAKAEARPPKPSVANQRPGRPTGRQNTHPAEGILTPE